MMQQLEIEYFFPLTEQIPLELDYEECGKPMIYWTTEVLGTSGQFLTNGGTGSNSWSTTNVTPTFKFHSNPITVGYWTVAENVQVYQEKKPRWMVRKMSELLLGWNWKDK
jgi:hypothetical protein